MRYCRNVWRSRSFWGPVETSQPTSSWRRAWLFVTAAGALIGCPPALGPRKPIEMEPIGSTKNIPTTPKEDVSDSGVTTPNSGTPPPGGACTGGDFDNLEEMFRQCEVPMPKASEVPSLRDKLEVKTTTSAGSTTPGGRIDVIVTLKNKSSDPIAIYLTGESSPRFEVEAFDSKNRRVDLPSGRWPGYPKGTKPESRENKAAKITLESNGTAKMKVQWDAVKTKWAPDRAKTWEGRGHPRTPSGPIGPGKYSIRVIVPVIGDVESPPKMPVEITTS